MRTYYIHGKITIYAFHLKATLNQNPPAGYYLIRTITARTVQHAINTFAKILHIAPVQCPEPLMLQIPDGEQTSYIKKD